MEGEDLASPTSAKPEPEAEPEAARVPGPDAAAQPPLGGSGCTGGHSPSAPSVGKTPCVAPAAASAAAEPAAAACEGGSASKPVSCKEGAAGSSQSAELGWQVQQQWLKEGKEEGEERWEQADALSDGDSCSSGEELDTDDCSASELGEEELEKHGWGGEWAKPQHGGGKAHAGAGSAARRQHRRWRAAVRAERRAAKSKISSLHITEMLSDVELAPAPLLQMGCPETLQKIGSALLREGVAALRVVLVLLQAVLALLGVSRQAVGGGAAPGGGRRRQARGLGVET